jgi:hypothetical protein
VLNGRRPVAIALLSGGLDSMLAAKVILEQGVTVIGVNFSGAYCPAPSSGKSAAQRAAEQLGIELVTLPIDQEFIEMVKHPKHGRGKNMNPCIDCHTLMICRAWERGRGEVRSQKPEVRMQKSGAEPEIGELERSEPRADFIITGEVLGQRPMSQNRQALVKVAKESGTEGRLVRPLSAKLLDETLPEKEGLLERRELMDIEGRSRKRQFGLAAQYGLREFPTPAGGCLLTERIFSARLREAFEHGEDSVETVELLRFGRHFRLPSGARVVVGRDKDENRELLSRVPKDAGVIDGTAIPGPLCLLIPDRSDDLRAAAAICARYSDRRKEKQVKLKVGSTEIEVAPATADEIAVWRIG